MTSVHLVWIAIGVIVLMFLLVAWAAIWGRGEG